MYKQYTKYDDNFNIIELIETDSNGHCIITKYTYEEKFPYYMKSSSNSEGQSFMYLRIKPDSDTKDFILESFS